MAEKDATLRLRRAVKENNLFLVKRLVQRTEMRNPDPSTRRYTSLAWAAVLGHEETFEHLLSAGHDDDELSRDSENNTILMLLADYKPPLCDSYSARSSDANDAMGAALRMARLYYDRYPYVLDWSNSQGKTALHIGALKGNEELVRMLCDLGADYDLSDNKGNTALHYASSWGHIPVVQLLIERGCQYAARNNQGFTASDYAYSFSTRDTLQDTARLQFENNKKARRAVFAQAAEKGNEWGGALPLGPSSAQNSLPRMRSGSGNSRSTAVSDGDFDGSTGLGPRKASFSSSPPSMSSMPNSFRPTRAVHSPKLSSASSNSTFSTIAPDPSMLTAPNVASALSPIATRMRERDASAMEKYMNRNRSGSQGTSSTDNKSQNGSLVTPATSVDDISLAPLTIPGSVTPRRLRPSMSAAQLRPTPESPSENSPDGTRSRSGTTPSSARSVMSPPLLSRSSSISNSPRTAAFFSRPVLEENKYTGPPSQYAQFPEPPAPLEHEHATPTAGRRVGFHILSRPAPLDPSGTSSHRRGLSATSVRGG